MSRNIRTLLEKPHALYLNSDENIDININLNKVFTREIIESSIVCSNFGYNINTDTGNFLEKRKTKKIIQNNNNEIPSLNKRKIKEFAKVINDLIKKRVD